MEILIPLLWEWRFVISLIAGLFIYAIFEWTQTKRIIANYIVSARTLAKKFVLESGTEQEDWVVDHVWDVLPAPVIHAFETFGGKDALRKLVKNVYETLKDGLDNGKLDGSWKS